MQKSLAAFSFDTIGAKEKAIKKKSAEREVSPLARGEGGVAPPPHELLKKLDQNFHPIGETF